MCLGKDGKEEGEAGQAERQPAEIPRDQEEEKCAGTAGMQPSKKHVRTCVPHAA